MTDETVRFGAKWREVLRPQPLTMGDGDSINNDIILTENQQSLVLSVDADQFTKLLSSAINGANIYFPDEYLEIIYPLIKAGKMALCDEIANCINNSQVVQDAIASATAGSANNSPTGGEYGQGSNEPAPNSVDDSDILVGNLCTVPNSRAIARGLTEVTFTIVSDAYEIIESATNSLEIYNEIADNFPAVAWLNVASEVAAWIQETAQENFDAFETIPRKEEIAEDIFCIIQNNNCELSFDDLWQYFAGKSVVAFIGFTLKDFLEDLITITDVQVVGFASLAFMYGTLALEQRFGGVLGTSAMRFLVKPYLDQIDNNPFPDESCVPQCLDYGGTFLGAGEDIQSQCMTIIEGYYVPSLSSGSGFAEVRDDIVVQGGSCNAELTIAWDNPYSGNLRIICVNIVTQNNRHNWRYEVLDEFDAVIDVAQAQVDASSPYERNIIFNNVVDARKVRLRVFRVAGSNGAYMGMRNIRLTS